MTLEDADPRGHLFKLPFRIHLIRIYERKSALTVRVMLVETTSAQPVYEGFGSWSKCRRWINQLSSVRVSRGELAVVRKLLDQRRLATILEVRASPYDLESLGLHRVDS
jgi:hypothetical protein